MQQDRLSVLIIGGGIAGLAAGLALREFADVQIIESAHMLKEVGAAVTLRGGVIRFLRSWGIDPTAVGAVPTSGIRAYNGAGELLHTKPLEDTFSFHRAHLHSALKRKVEAEDGPGRPCNVLLGHKVARVDSAAGTVVTVNGTEFSADVIIAADGIRSNARPFIAETSEKPQPIGESCYRLLVPVEDLLSARHEIVKSGSIEPVIVVVVDSGRKIVAYPCSNGQLLNVASFVLDSELNEPVNSESWNTKGDIESLVKSIETFAPTWQNLMRCGKDVAVWQIRDMAPLPNWVNGRAILIGDAAHPMATHQAGGAMSAIEDAEALGAFLRGVDRDGVHDALRRVFRVRFRRVSEIQAASRRESLVGSPGFQRRSDGGLETYEYVGAEQWERERPDMVLGPEELGGARAAV